ncbi:MAG: dockerin type I repeat-containing protein, partial [Chloroflexi bacterium]|nr:dockerin type I repeat-containing protein [Chloroflexota bacterium]
TFPGLLGFRAAAGETYYLQFSSFSRKRTPVFVAGAPLDTEPPSVGDGETASVGNGGNLEVHLESRAIPSCPPPAFSVEDRANDVNVWFAPPEAGRPHDIVSVGSSSTDDEFCIRVELAGPVDPPSAGTDHALVGTFVFDTDEDEHSGSGLYVCGSTRGLGVDVVINVRGGFGLLEPIQRFIGEPGQIEKVGRFAIALFDGNIFTLVVPLEAIGGDDSLRFALMVSDEIIGGSDCAPDRGFIQVPPPAFGDANCDGAVDSRDAVIILQFFARLTDSLPCESVADANGNGTIGSIDAALILQLDAGLINVLPGAP